MTQAELTSQQKLLLRDLVEDLNKAKQHVRLLEEDVVVRRRRVMLLFAGALHISTGDLVLTEEECCKGHRPLRAPCVFDTSGDLSNLTCLFCNEPFKKQVGQSGS